MKSSLWTLKALVFLAAFLLFQIEPIIAKTLLPLYGGSYLVWGACVVFFQAMLLAGYVFAHWVLKRFKLVRYQYAHMILLFLPLIVFPGRSLSSIQPHPNIPVSIDIFVQLFFLIGPVFFMLSTFSIILQAWLAASSFKEKINPYFLYSISNLGSFAALLTYPFIVEPLLDLDQQLLIWRSSYFVLLALQIFLLNLSTIRKEEKAEGEEVASPLSREEVARWLLLGAGGSIMFLSVTTLITTEIAPFPLLWIIPLSIYLLSFVLNFKFVPWCPSWIKNKIHIIFAFSLIMYFVTQKQMIPFAIEMIIYLFFLFVICMYCQNELILHKPRQKTHLTLFYVMISLGSFIGSLFITWVLPLISNFLIEYFIGLAIISFTFFLGKPKERINSYSVRLIVYLNIFIGIWPLLFKEYHFWALLMLFLSVGAVFSAVKKNRFALHIAVLSICAMSPVIDSLGCYSDSLYGSRDYVYRHRNYYGIFKVYDIFGTRFLLHGTTLHGAQYLDKLKENEPLTYYHKGTPGGEILSNNSYFPKMGVIGLGAGSLAAYADETNEVDFFEIDKDVVKIAREYFTYLKNSKAHIKINLGDARVSLEKRKKPYYNLLVVDAFSGDAIPIHLLTVEAIELYRQVILHDGLILMHVSNRYLRLVPVILSNARSAQAYCVFKRNSNIQFNKFSTEWIAITWNKKMYDSLVEDMGWESLMNKPLVRPWTDGYANLVPTIDVKSVFASVKGFEPFKW